MAGTTLSYLLDVTEITQITDITGSNLSENTTTAVPQNGTVPPGKQDDVLKRTVYMYIIPTLMLIGVIGNGISIPILMRLRTASAVLLAVLMLCDLLLLVGLFVLYSGFYWVGESMNRDVVLATVHFNRILQIFQAWNLVLIALDRCVAIRSPFRYHRIVTHRRAALMCLIIFIVGVIFHLPSFFAMKTMCMKSPSGEKRCQIAQTPFGRTKGFVNYWSYSSLVFIRIIPVLLQIFLVSITTYTIRQANQMVSKQMGKFAQRDVLRQKERTLTAVLLGVICVHVILHIPVIINNIFETQHNIQSEDLKSIVPGLVAFNCMIDFLVYVCGTKVCRQALTMRLRKSFHSFSRDKRPSTDGTHLTGVNHTNSRETLALCDVRKSLVDESLPKEMDIPESVTVRSS